MAITIYPVTPDFAAEIGDVDLASPLSAADREAISEAFWKYAVLIFPEQHLSPQQHLEFAGCFGPIEMDRVLDKSITRRRLDMAFSDISNLDQTGAIWNENSRRRMFKAGDRLWHTDSSFKFRPGMASLLYSRSIAPIGGHTEFADQRSAWDTLPESVQKEIDGLVAEHSIATSRLRSGFVEFTSDEATRLPPVPQALVRTIRENGRKSLYVASHAGRILGLPEAEGRALIDRLLEHATRREFVYTHRWRRSELVMWDNRCTLHRGTDYDDLRWVRDMHRVTVSDVANTCVQEGLAVAG